METRCNWNCRFLFHCFRKIEQVLHITVRLHRKYKAAVFRISKHLLNPIKQNTWNICQLNIVTRKNWKHYWLLTWIRCGNVLTADSFQLLLLSSLQNLALCEIPCEEFSLKAFKSSRFPLVLVLEVFGKLILFRRLIKQIKPACRCLLTTNLNDTRNQVHSTK